MKTGTKLIHAGEPEPRVGGAAVPPIFQSSVYEYRGGSDYASIPYPRLSTLPNQVHLGRKLAALEGAEAGLVTSSGMAAITSTLLAVLGRGGHVIAQRCLYGGTHAFLTRTLEQLGFSYDLVDGDAPEQWAAAVKPTTRAIYTEAITNPLMGVADHAAVVKFARERNLVSVIDATFCTPINFRPIALGYDVVVHSATKYLNGHSDLSAGAVLGRADAIRDITGRLATFGGHLDPNGCFLLHRGLKTLEVRVERQNRTAQVVAEFLAGHPAVRAVNYPGLDSHPDHGRARELFRGFGGMLSFELHGGADAAERLLDGVSLPVCGPSLGGCETLLTRPAQTSHAGMSPQDRRALGIADGLVRMSVGLETVEDLLEDVERGLSSAAPNSAVETAPKT